MKKKIIIAVCALLMCATTPASVKNDTIDVFYIDGARQDHFDGFLLVGKSVTNYNVDYVLDNGHTIATHSITTDKPNQYAATVSKVVVTDSLMSYMRIQDGKVAEKWEHKTTDITDSHRPVLVLNGKMTDYNTINEIYSKDIKSVTVMKAGSEAAKQFGTDAASRGVIVMETKDKTESDDIIVIDDTVVGQEMLDALNKEQVESMTVLKKGSQAAMEYAKGNRNLNVILVRTKKQQ